MANKLVTVTQLDTAVDGFASAVAAAGYEEKANLKKLAYEDDVTIDVMTTDLKTLLDGKMTQAKAQELVDQNVGKAYKPGGSKTLATLPALTEANFGHVYHMTEDFVTTDDFVEGLGKSYTAGTEVAIVEIPGANEGDPVTYKYNVLSSYIDTSKFAAQSSFSVVKAAVDAIEVASNSDIQALIDGMSLDEETVLATGTYDASGNLLKSWNQLATDGDVIITNGELTTPNDRPTRFANVEKVVIDPSVTNISDSAFDGCTGLTTINIPDSVTSIGTRSFYNCRSLTTINIPNSVTSIGGDAFMSCDNLTTITIPDSVTSISNNVFRACTSLATINIPDSVTSIGNRAFAGCTSLTEITIPDSVTTIGNGAFEDCTGPTKIIIPDGVTSISPDTFNGCTSLTEITIPSGVTSIGNSAFNTCTSLTTINIPDSVTSIDRFAFKKCTNLTTITIPDSVTSIGDRAFENCDNLATIYYSGTATGAPWSAPNATVVA